MSDTMGPAGGWRKNDLSIAIIGECMIEIVRRQEGECGFGYAGDTLNAALYMSRLGMRPSYVTAIGSDAFSDAMIDFWRGEEIGTELVVRRSDRMPGLYIVSTNTEGEHQFNYWRSDSAARTLFSMSDDERLLVALPSFPRLYWSGISMAILETEARARLIEVLARARHGGTQIIFDTNYRARLWPDPALARMAYEAALAVSDLVFTSIDDELPVFASGSEAGLVERHRRAGVVETVVKYGRLGSRVIVHGSNIDFAVDAPPATAVVDTTAAGDSFAAAYVSARAQKIDPGRAALIGHRLAGAKCASRGAILPKELMPKNLLAV
jgi:2-dehydro-3-deoxygluconokinase